MKLKQNKYSFLFAFLAIIGLFTSLVHYHSDGLECLDHAEEAHIIESNNFCPICTLVTKTDYVPVFEFRTFLTLEGIVVDSYTTIISSPFPPSLKGRSPPFQA